MTAQEAAANGSVAPHGDALAWLLEPADPGVRYLALRDLLGRPVDDPELVAARAEAHRRGPIAHVLKYMQPEGYWSKPGPGYGPKYRSTAWALSLLAQLGASAQEDGRIAAACRYYLDHAAHPQGQISTNSGPAGTIDCLQGNMCAALISLGCDDPRLDAAFDWMARTVTGEGLAPKTEKQAELRYYAYNCGPVFACGANRGLSCGWGATKVMLAFAKLPEGRRTPVIDRAIDQGVAFLLSVDPASAMYPMPAGAKPNRAWWQFGFPVFYITDVLQVGEALAAFGLAQDPRLGPLLQFVRSKQDAAGRWKLEYTYAGKTWGNYGAKGEPSKWVTLRALRVLKAAG